MPTPRLLLPLLAMASLGAAPASAESALRLPYPTAFGTVPASTFDHAHKLVGQAHLVVEKLDDGHVRMFSESGFDGGARTVLVAELEPVQTESGPFLRPLMQESRSFDPDGNPLGILSVDHRKGIGTCTPAASEDKKPAVVELPSRDRVANVPLNLLFEPLVREEVEEIDFQVLLCRFGARLVNFRAKLEESHNGNGSHPKGSEHIVRVIYKPNLGRFVGFVAGGYLPTLSFWFDRRATNPWVAHRVPLYSKGPEVLIVREGVPAGWLEEPSKNGAEPE